MTDEEMAEEYAKVNMHYEIAERENGAKYAKAVSSVTIEQAYLAGLKAGKPRWHDLRKDHSDLPESDLTVLDEDGNKITYQGGGKWTFYSDYYEMDIEAIPPVAWCEIPTFEV